MGTTTEIAFELLNGFGWFLLALIPVVLIWNILAWNTTLICDYRPVIGTGYAKHYPVVVMYAGINLLLVFGILGVTNKRFLTE